MRHGIVAAGWPAWLALALAWLTTATVAVAEPAAHYQIKARFDAKAGAVAAEVVIDLPQAAAETHFLLGERFTLDAVGAGPGVKVAIERTDKPLRRLHDIVFRSSAAGHRRLTFRFHGPLDEAGGDLPNFSAERMEIDLETMWLPVRQDLQLPFTIDADISGLPDGLDVMTQGRLERHGDRLTLHRTVPDNDLTLAGARGLKLVKAPDVDFYAADPSDPLVAMLRKHAFGSAAWYRQVYGAPDPGPIVMVIVPRASGAGYARRGMVVMPTFRKPGDPVPPFDEASPARFVAHEFRHAWGDTPSTAYSDYWMSESVAEYFGLRYVEKVLGSAELKAMLERKRPAVATGGPLIGVDHKPTGAALYQKGPVLLFDLEARIGRPALERILAHPNPPATTDAFLKALAAEAGADVAKDFETKLK